MRPSGDAFVGGTVDQAFLDAPSDHRWHKPGRRDDRPGLRRRGDVRLRGRGRGRGEDPAGPKKSQGSLAHVATRALIFIEADDPGIGLLCLLPVGMVEVSSCLIGPDIKAGTRVAKGDELGYFQFGGSTSCLVFRPGAIAGFTLNALPEPDHPDAPLVLVRSRISLAN